MSQHDLVIDNQSAPASRADINNALQALGTLSSGATAPATTYANMLWYDTATDLLKIRNEANSAWITVGTVDQTNSVFNPNFLPATQAEAEAGTNNVKGVTPLRVAQAIAALSPSTTPFETWGCTVTLVSTSAFIIPSGKKYIIIACGGGGGAIVSSGSVNSDTKALGGNGGSVVLLAGTTSSSTTLTITIGSGGAGKTSGTSNGNLGGTTTVTGTGINISAAGGKGGLQVGTVAVASDANAASSGGIVFEPGLWNVGAHTDGNISFSGTSILGGGGTLSGSTTTGMSGGNDSFNSQYIYQSITTINNFTEDETRVIWPLQAQSIGTNIGQPAIITSTKGGNAGDASADTGGGAGVYGGGGGGGADSASSSGAGGGGWVVLWVQK